jgi:alkylation response protein AidB-like acyl-CoA dehydrogenase
MTTENAALLRSLSDEVLAPLAARTRSGAVALGEPWEVLRDLGWPTAGVPDALGGGGGDIGDVLALAEGLGRNAVPLPLLEAQSACAAAAAGGRGDLLGLPLVVETWPRWSALRITDDNGRLRISGTARRTPWARHASAILIRVSEAGASRWIACDLPNEAVTISPGANLAGEPRDDVRFDDLVVPAASSWGCHDESPASLGILLRCAALVGAIDATVTLTGRYVREREQFGRPLQALQPVAQAVALMRAQLSAARAAVDAAAQSPVAGNVLAAHVDLAGYAGRIARAAHDLHGAMGVTEEYGLHRLTKRLWAWPEEGIRQLDARAELGRRAAAGGVAGLWDSVIA